MIKKIWTGDSGITKLCCEETTKDSLLVDAYGDVDELNSYLGLVRARLDDKEIDAILKMIQNDLFIIGSDLAKAPKSQKSQLTEEHVKKLEETVHEIQKQLPPLNKFILPSGTPASALLHIARSVCRRAERKVFFVKRHEIVNEEIPRYLNRLSTLLFDLARLTNKRAGIKEDEW